MTLPSGRVVRVRVTPGEAIANDVVEGRAMFAGRFVNAITSGRFAFEDDANPDNPNSVPDANPDNPNSVPDAKACHVLPLRDFHALRDVAIKLGVIEAEESRFACSNCEAEIEIPRGAELLADIEQWYAEENDEVPRRVRVGRMGGEKNAELVMEPVTFGEARPLFVAVVSGRFDFTPSVVRAMGVRSIGGVGDPRGLSRMLARAPEGKIAILEGLYVLLNYAARSYTPVVCRACGSVETVDAPFARELDLTADAERRIFGDPISAPKELVFPSLDDFTKRAFAIAERVYVEQQVRNIELVVEEGPAPVDEGGVALLGSYEPRVPLSPVRDAQSEEHGFRISLFYRTFETMFADEPYDVDAEIEETIEHEVEHHVFYLSGHDPMDEEERREARQELVRTFGEQRVRRAETLEAKREVTRTAVFFGFVVVLLLVMGLAYQLVE